jgi:ATP-binding cassette, subfamily B, bacterial
MQETNTHNIVIPRTPIRFALFASRPYWHWGLGAVLSVTLAGTLDSATYYVFKELIDTATSYTAGTVALSAVVFWIFAYPLTASGHQFLYRTAGFFAMTWLTATRTHGANMLFRYLSLHSIPYFNNRFAGSTANKIWNASGGAQGMFETFLWGYLSTFIAFVTSAILVFTVSVGLGAMFVGWILALVVINYFLSKKTSVYSERRAAVRSRISGTVVDIVTNMLAVKNYARRAAEIARVEEGTEELRIASWRNWFYTESLLVFNNVLMAFFAVSMITGGYYLWSNGSITVGELIMVLTLLNGIMGWFSFIGTSMNQFAERYGEVLEGLNEIAVPHDMLDATGAKQLAVSEGKLAFNDVTFAYNEANVFENFTLTIKPGERVGIVGPSGSGKTTFVSLLLRQHDIQKGSITIDGTDIREVTQESLHDAIAIVPQEPSLFHRSIRDNISYGRPDATDEEVEAAARKAQAHDFIAVLPDGYKTLVGERGVKLSGGQRQRVAIARAILKAAPILILDEATSSLDSESETEIQKALHVLMEGKTVIAIAHRLSTIKEMDRIIVMEGGAIAEDGSHDELVAKEGGLYARLWAHQAGGFIEG